MSPAQKYRDEKWLREQYVEKKNSTHEISEMCGCAHTTILTWLEKHDIKTRKRVPEVDPRLKNGEWLRQQYLEEVKSTHEIAELCDCSHSVVLTHLEKHEIEKRERTEKTVSSRLKDEQWLREQYVEKGLSTTEIGDLCDVSQRTACRWLDRHGIETRGKDNPGEENPNWKGGPVPYGSGWGTQKRQSVRERDGYECVRCGIKQSQHKDDYGQKLHVHHLIKARDVEDPEERNAAQNLITLCRDCHRRWEKIADAGLVPQLD